MEIGGERRRCWESGNENKDREMGGGEEKVKGREKG